MLRCTLVLAMCALISGCQSGSPPATPSPPAERASSPVVAPGAKLSGESVEDVEAISRIQDVVAQHYRPGGSIPEESAAKLEAFMRPDRPVLTRMRAMKFGQVIGQERFKKVLLEAWNDPDPRVRRTAVAKADTVLDLWPHEVASLKDDADPGVRAAWEMWSHTIKIRTETGRDPSTGASVRPPAR